jgi:hypothetical protein
MTDKVQTNELAGAMAAAAPEDGVGLLAGLSAPDAYKLLLEHPQPAEIVALIPTESLYLMLQEIGTQDALELLEMASTEQVQGFIDIDCWDRDRLDLAKARTWFLLLNELDDDAFIRDVQEMDLALLVAFFGAHLTIHILDDRNDEFDIDGVTFVTPDNRHLIEYTCSVEISKLINGLFARIAQLDVDFFLNLLEAIHWETGTETEEAAYEDRVKRLESRGFPDYYQSLEILVTVDLERFQPGRKTAPLQKSKEPGARISGSRYLVKYEHRDSLLRRALALPFDGRDDVAVEIMGLANMATVAEKTPFLELDRVSRLVARTDGYISIGLEHLVGDDPVKAAAQLVESRVIDIHKIGRTLVMNEARRVHKLLPRLAVDGRSPNKLLLDGPEGDALAGLLAAEPTRRADGVDQLWTEMAQVLETRRVVEIAERFVDLMGGRFGFTPEKIRGLDLAGCNIADPVELSYRVLFNTFLGRDLLGREPSPEPLAGADLTTLAPLMTVARGRADLPAAKRRDLARWLRSALGKTDAPPVLAILERYGRALAAELVRNDPEHRFRQETLVRLS